MVEAEGIFLEQVNGLNAKEVVLENYNKSFDFVNGFAANSSDYLKSGFNVNLSTPNPPLTVNKTFVQTNQQ